MDRQFADSRSKPFSKVAKKIHQTCAAGAYATPRPTPFRHKGWWTLFLTRLGWGLWKNPPHYCSLVLTTLRLLRDVGVGFWIRVNGGVKVHPFKMDLHDKP